MNLGDTKSITIHEDELSGHPNNYKGWSKEYAQLVIKKALETVKFDNIDAIEFTKYFCTEVEEGNSWSEVCYIETKHAGFYFVMRDMIDHINVIYNRWD